MPARTTSRGPRSRRWMSGLLVGEIALSVILLASAGLLIRSARMLYAADQVIDVSNLVTARLSLPPGKYGTPQERIAFYEQLELRLASIPSIASAAIGTALPFIGATRRDVALDSDLEAAAAGTRSAQTLAIGSRYFETLGLSLQRGRSFDARDGLPGQETVIVNERFVTMYLPGQDAIGRRIRLIDSGSTRASSAPLTIVGIAPTVRHTPARDASPVVYLPSRAQPAATMEMMMRSRGQQHRVSVPVARRSANTRRRRSALQHLDARAAVAAVALDPACAQLHARTVRSHRDAAVGDGTLRRHDVQHLAADVGDRDTDGARGTAAPGIVAVSQGHARACWPRPHNRRGRRGSDGAGAARSARADERARPLHLRKRGRAAGGGRSGCLPGADVACISAGPCSRTPARLILIQAGHPAFGWRVDMWRWTTRILIGLCAGLIVAACSGATYQWISTRKELAETPPPGRLVDVGGHRLHIWCTGAGEPSVILETGLGGSTVGWGFVQPEVARFTRVCSYDRAGLGYSDPGPSPRTTRRIARELEQLLDRSGIAGPWVLVGASSGGFTARLFASERSERVAGLVLVDASHEDQAHDIPRLAPFVPFLSSVGVLRLLGVSFGPTPSSLAPSVRGFARATKFRAAGYQAAADEIIHIRESAAEVRSTRRELTIPRDGRDGCTRCRRDMATPATRPGWTVATWLSDYCGPIWPCCPPRAAIGRCGGDPRDRGYGERAERRVPLCAHRRRLTPSLRAPATGRLCRHYSRQVGEGSAGQSIVRTALIRVDSFPSQFTAIGRTDSAE